MDNDKASGVSTQALHKSRSPDTIYGLDRKWWVLIAIGISTLMSALDGSVVNTTLPIIKQSFSSNFATIEWVVTIYLLVLSGLLLSFGRLGDILGHKPVYIAGFIIFLVSSALCGFSTSIGALICFRGFQASGAAMIQANSPAILTKSFPSQQRGQALGMVATMTYLGLTIGPSFGGWLAEQLGWRAIFYINVPVGLVALILSIHFIILNRPSHGEREKFDLSGALLFTAGLVSLLLGLNQGHALGWTSPVILAELAAAILLLGTFVCVQARTASPMLDLGLFSNRTFSAAVGSAVLNYICLYSILFLMPFYLIQGRGFSPTQTGLLLTAQPVIMAVVAPLSGALSDRIGTRLPSAFGMLLLSSGLFLLSQLGAHSPQSQIVLALGVTGLGTGIFISPNNSALMGAAPRHQQGLAAGTLATARNMGMALGVGLAGAIFTTTLSRQAETAAGALFAATHTSFLVTAIIAFLGTLVSASHSGQKFIKKIKPPR